MFYIDSEYMTGNEFNINDEQRAIFFIFTNNYDSCSESFFTMVIIAIEAALNFCSTLMSFQVDLTRIHAMLICWDHGLDSRRNK